MFRITRDPQIYWLKTTIVSLSASTGKNSQEDGLALRRSQWLTGYPAQVNPQQVSVALGIKPKRARVAVQPLGAPGRPPTLAQAGHLLLSPPQERSPFSKPDTCPL